MPMELVIEAAVSALMSAIATDVWPKARDRMSRAVHPTDPEKEIAALESLMGHGDEASRRAALHTHLTTRLQAHPEREEDLRRSVGEVEILIKAERVQVDAQTVNVYAPTGSSDASRLAVMQASRAARELEKLSEDEATTLLADMPADAAAKRLALMSNAHTLLSNMDDHLAAGLLGAMASPAPAELFGRIDQRRGAEILDEMTVEDAVRHLAELMDVNPGRAHQLVFSMNHRRVAQLLAVLELPHPAELFIKMTPDRASAVLAVMDREKAVWRLSEMPSDRAALLLSKMDKQAAMELLRAIVPSLSTSLLALMVTSDGAEVLAKADTTWARARLAQMPPQRALELLVALRPPRNLLKEIDDELAGRLLPAAVIALARRIEDTELIDAAQKEAERILAEAERQAHGMLTHLPKPVEPEAVAPPALADRILDSLRHRANQTLVRLARNIREPEPAVRAEVARLVADGRVIERAGSRSVEHYSVAPD